MVFGAIYQDHFFKFKNFYFSLHPTTCSIRSGTFANQAERTELQSIRWLSSGAVPEEEKCQSVSEPGDVIVIAKG